MHTIDLSGTWALKQGGKAGTIAAPVPGDVHLALLEAGKIPDPYFRDNELATRWVGRTDWIYGRTFAVPAAFLAHKRILLRCEGLDTLATIKVNGRAAGTADNMFRTWEFAVRRLLKPGANTISVHFAAPVPYAEKTMKREKYCHQWGGPLEQKGRAWLRKEQCNFGWDWGPTLVTSGIWRAIGLVGFSDARLADLQILQAHVGGRVGLEVRVATERAGSPQLGLRVTVALAGRTVALGVTRLSAGRASVRLGITAPKLWWPNGMGEQPLYTVTAELVDAAGAVIDSHRRRIGLRTLVLERKPDQWGESFQFVANGVPFFAKGANWIPADAVLARLTPDDYRRLVLDAAAANMNMLRLWGGGIYEHDAFYDACDEHGICIWHDFMFAYAAYPVFKPGFMESVRAEAEDNVRRVRHHPSIALWCGNNELEQGLVRDKWGPNCMAWRDYAKLFDVLLPDVVKRLDPQRDYWPCSPHSPHGDRQDFNNPKWGDAHLWDVWHGKKPFEWYRTCTHRFNSEFGFQSFPEPRTVRGYTLPADRNITSRIMEHHQRSGIGNTTIMQYMLDWFRLPEGFDNTLWCSQILHGMAMKYAVEHWRRSMPRGMGTLYWQINDCWPVASWASIDYHGRWKALHYMARHFYAPVLVSGLEDADKGTVAVHLTSDQRTAGRGTVAWTVTDGCGRVLLKGRKAAQAKPLRNTPVTVLRLKPLIDRHTSRNVLVWLEYTVGGKAVSSNLVLFARPKHIELADPRIRAAVKAAPAGVFTVTLKTARPALWAWLELDNADACFSDNFVSLRPGQPVTVTVTPARRMTAVEFRKRLKVRSLFNTYV
ncbi:MAG: glycoside hydrolase family 2 protein [Planctomycetota bacterium]